MFRRKRSAEDFAEEIQAHIELEAEELRSEGLERGRGALARHGESSAACARRRNAFTCRADGCGWTDVLRDLSIRISVADWRAPGSRSRRSLTLALGMGANTAVFSVMNAVLLRSLPVADPDRVVYLRTSDPPHGTGTIDSHETFSYPVYDALRKQNGAMQR